MAAASNHHEIELRHIRDGYPALATWIGRDPDNEAYVFRKFDRLSARNILHLQCQLIQLEHEIDELDDAARQSPDFGTRQASRRWETLKELAKDPESPEKTRLDKADELAIKMKEYHEALLRQTRIAELNRPSDRVLYAFRDYLEGTAKGPGSQNLPIISGRAKEMLKEVDDLVALGKPAGEDLLSKLLQDHWAFQKLNTADPLDRTTVYKGNHVAKTVAAISVLCATVLLVAAIVSLYVVSSQTTKLGMVIVYTVLFAFSIALLTNAKRAEVYGAAAAYAAVLVVFISGNLGSSQLEQCMVQLSSGVFKTINCPSQNSSF